MESNSTADALNVGFIGLGDQGGPMARAIGEAGFPLHVWARRPESLDILADVPHVVHASVPELAGACDMVALVLTDDQDIWDILEQQGLRKAFRPGAIIVNHGTGDPSENARIAAYLNRHHRLDPTELRDRGLSGADGLVRVVNLLSAGVTTVA
jgi:3-hydroxyisobutyrate dehydrogenase-like beta-hydroxyacid dehydrogenase